MNASTVHERAVADERLARERQRRLTKARRARQSKHAAEVWRKVRAAKRVHHCTCELRQGMTLAELNALEAGCCRGRGWICPVLDKYRRLIGGAR